MSYLPTENKQYSLLKLSLFLPYGLNLTDNTMSDFTYACAHSNGFTSSKAWSNIFNDRKWDFHWVFISLHIFDQERLTGQHRFKFIVRHLYINIYVYIYCLCIKDEMPQRSFPNNRNKFHLNVFNVLHLCHKLLFNEYSI